MKRKFFIVLVLFGLASGSMFSAIPQIERTALIALYSSTNGDNWENNNGWREPPLHTDGFAIPGTEDNWYGVKIEKINSTDHVRQIILRDNNLIGPIAPEIGDLINLRDIFLSYNQLTGNVPPEIKNLTELEILWLGKNSLISLPPEIGNLINLRTLSFFHNRLANIPLEILSLTNLEELILDYNQLTNLSPEIMDFSPVPFSIKPIAIVYFLKCFNICLSTTQGLRWEPIVKPHIFPPFFSHVKKVQG